jgi:hypothetical protein
MMRFASNIDFRGKAERKKEYLALRRSSRASQFLANGPIRGREME